MPTAGLEKYDKLDLRNIEEAYPTATLKELQGMLYHILESEEPFKKNEDLMELVKSFEAIIHQRGTIEKKGPDERPKKATIMERARIKTTLFNLTP